MPVDDFLHNLRNQSKKPFDRNRSKPYDGQFRPNDRFAGRDRNKSNPQQQQQRKPVENDQLPVIKRLIEGLLEQQRKTADFGERTARAAERQAEALESIARHLKTGQPELAPEPVKTAATAMPEETGMPEMPLVPPEEANSRQDASTIILAQRAAGQGFEQIAQLLNTREIATVSGKGQWRAQSVSRLYNTLTEAEPPAPSEPAGADA